MGGWWVDGWVDGGWVDGWVDGWWVDGGWVGGWMGGGSGWEYVRGCRGDVQCCLSVAMATLECYFYIVYI